MTKVFETDWLASRPVFYHDRTGKVSHNVNDVIDFANLEFDPEGFNNYLDFGYSVFEQTPVKHVKFLRHSSRLWKDEQDALRIEYLEDPVEQWLDYRLSEADVIDLIRERVQTWERSVDGEIIIPTSGGYDSRLLNWCIQDKSRIRSFTYGISEDQAESYEVVYARKLSEILGTRWEQIPLGDFHKYFEDWHKLFGISTHAHGMYHIEFYSKLLPKVDGGNPFLSGIIGDAWSGGVDIPPLVDYGNVRRLGYTHGLQADSSFSKLATDLSLLKGFWEKQRRQLDDPRFRVVEAMRFKIMLLCYLRIVPQCFGFQWWSPFLDIDVCMAMLNLPPERRRKRAWQKEFFQKVSLDLESMHLPATHQNNLNHQAMRRIPVPPLSVKLLREVIQPDYVHWINWHVGQQGRMWDWFWQNYPKIAHVRGGWRLSRLLNIREQRLLAYCAYLTLKPIEQLIKKRDDARMEG